jgi:hypothetical protein
MAPHLLLLLAGCSTQAPPARPDRHPDDAPPWGTASYLPYARLDAPGERAIAIDVPGGPLDVALADPDVTTVLTDKFALIFLHPRAREELTRRFGYPSLTAVDAEGCVRARVVAPRSAKDVLAALNQALRARRDRTRSPLPALASAAASTPGGGGTWTIDDPAAARAFADPARGAPAVIWEGKPYLWGNRRDAQAVLPSPAAEQFLAKLPADALADPQAPPILRCPLPQ